MVYTIVILERLCEAVIFLCKWELEGFLLPDDMSSNKTGVTEETVAMALVKKHPHDPPPSTILH